MADAPRSAVLGGGALGLTLALRLAQRGHRVTVFEREPTPGGLAAGFKPGPDSRYLDKFYHHLFRSDRRAIALIHELGLGANLEWGSPTNAVLYGGKRWRPYTPLGVLSFSPLGAADRVRMAAALAVLKATPTAKPFERTTADAWLPRAMGRRAYEVLWRPLLKAKFGDRFDSISMAWFWARIHDRSFSLGYLHGGFQRLYDRLVEEIKRLGGEVLLGYEVLEATHGPTADASDRWTVRWRRADPPEALAHSSTFRRVISTLPTRLTLRLVPQLPEPFRRRYDWGEAYGAHCLILALDRRLLADGTYWLNVNDPGYPFLVLVEHTNWIPAGEYGGRHLVYLGNYLPMDHPLFRQSKEEILEVFLPAVRRIVPGFQDGWVRDSWAFAAPYAQPIVTREFPGRIPPAKAPLPELWLGSMFQVYPHDRGQNYSIQLAERLAEKIGPPP